MLTGESISLFLDKDTLKWGEEWRERINSSLSSVAFFIPVLTPRYFMSPECRRELQFFTRQATKLGISEIVLPLLYVGFPAFYEEPPKDDLVRLIKSFQWEDWQDLRFADVLSEGYRRGVSRLAGRLVDANKSVEEVKIPAGMIKNEKIINDNMEDTPGFLDQMVEFEEALPKWIKTLKSIENDIKIIGELMREATDNIKKADSQGGGFSARLFIVRKVAKQIEEPINRIWSSGNDFASQIHTIDIGVRIIIEKAPTEVKENPNSKANFCNFFDSVSTLSIATEKGLKSIQKMINSITPTEKMARDLHPPLRKLRNGLTIMVEAGEVNKEWVQLIRNSGILCDNGKINK